MRRTNFRAEARRTHDIFHTIDSTSAHADSPINHYAKWYTWSGPFRELLHALSPALRALSSPRLSRVRGLTLYNQTYSWPPQRLERPLRERFGSFVDAFAAIRPGRKLMLFDRLIGPHLDSQALHALLALLRGALVMRAGDPRAAMYTPLGEVGEVAGGFPLHADLYIPPFLFNVFDNVATQEGGVSTFLPVVTLRKLIPSIWSLPALQGRTILTLLDHAVQKDQFEVLYDLLHGHHRWVGALERAMERRQLSIRFAPGQGYLLHDRKWLHGRAATKGNVPIDRVRRLVFGGVPQAGRTTTGGARNCNPKPAVLPHSGNTGMKTPV